MEYGNQIWSPYKVTDIDLIENVQRKFLKRVFKRCKLPDMSYIERCKFANLETLQFRRTKTDLLMFYKLYFNEISSLDKNSYLVSVNSRRRANDYQLRVKSKNPSSEWAKQLFFERTVRLWKTLPNDLFPESNNLNSKAFSNSIAFNDSNLCLFKSTYI